MTGLEPATTGITKQPDAHDGVISDHHTRRSRAVSPGPDRLGEAARGAAVGQVCPTLAPHHDAPEQRGVDLGTGAVPAPDGVGEGSRGVPGGNSGFVMPTRPTRHRRTPTSPEHLHSYSGAPTAASDVFSVGILLYAALTAALPIPYTGDDADYVRRLLAVDMTPLDSLRPDLSPDQLLLVARCLHPQPARRYLNGSKLAEAFGALA